MSFFVSSYLNEFATKRCKKANFTDQGFYSTKFNKHKQPQLHCRTLEVMTG